MCVQVGLVDVCGCVCTGVLLDLVDVCGCVCTGVLLDLVDVCGCVCTGGVVDHVSLPLYTCRRYGDIVMAPKVGWFLTATK